MRHRFARLATFAALIGSTACGHAAERSRDRSHRGGDAPRADGAAVGRDVDGLLRERRRGAQQHQPYRGQPGM